MEAHSDSPLYRIRHSMAHVMAQAVRKLFPEGLFHLEEEQLADPGGLYLSNVSDIASIYINDR